jgi:hypothetical protein
LIERVPQALRCKKVAFQVSNDRPNTINSSGFGGDAAGNGQGNANDPVQMRQRGRAFKVQNWQGSALQRDNIVAPWHHSEFGCGALAHDGSLLQLVNWDDTKRYLEKLLGTSRPWANGLSERTLGIDDTGNSICVCCGDITGANPFMGELSYEQRA